LELLQKFTGIDLYVHRAKITQRSFIARIGGG